MSRDTIPAAVRILVLARDESRCAACGQRIEVGFYSIHHRRRKGMGGDKRPDANLPGNLVTLCGSGTTGCHGWVHANPKEASFNGYLVSKFTDPLSVPVHLVRWGRGLYLDHDGGVSERPPEGVAA